MNFLNKLKGNKRKNRSDLPETDTPRSDGSITEPHPKELSPEAPDSTPDDSLDDPTGHAVQIGSIFSGLHLSSKVARGEAPDSPYMHKETSGKNKHLPMEEELDNGVSSFAFLGGPSGKSTGVEDVNDDDESQSTPGFSFLNQPPSVDLPVTCVPQDHVEQDDTSSLSQPDHNMVSLDQVHQSELPNLSISVAPKSKDEKTRTQQVAAGKHAPVPGGKKRKRKAIRPGLNANKEGDATVSGVVDKGITDNINEAGLEGDDSKQEDTVSSLPLPISLSNPSTPTSSLNELLTPASSLDESLTLGTSRDESPTPVSANDEPSTPPLCDNETSILTASLEQLTPADEATRDSCQMVVDVQRKVDYVQSETLEQGNRIVESSLGDYTIQFSHEETLAGLLQSYASGLSRLRNSLSVIGEKHTNLLHDRMASAQRQVDRWLKDCSLREREAKALAEEDYELAEQLSNQLDRTQVNTEQEIASACLTEIHSWIVKYAEEKENEVSFQKEIEVHLTSLRERHDMALEQLRKEHAALLSKEKMQLQTSVNEVERESGHIALDLSHLEKREQLLVEETSRRAVNFITKKEQLGKTLDETESEIESLEAKLTLLKSKRAEIMACIINEEENIKTVEEELSEEKLQLKSERAEFQERQDRLSDQQKLLDDKRLAVDTMEERQQEERRSLEDLVTQAGIVWEEVQAAVSGRDKTNLHVQNLLQLLEDKQKLLSPSEELTQAQSAVGVKKKEVEEHAKIILKGQQELGDKRKKVLDLQAQVQQLQESKKAAVTGRQFKEAARLTSEIKVMCGLVEESQEKLNEAEQSMVLSSKKLAQLSDQLSKVREEWSILEKTEDEAHIEELIQTVSVLGSKSETLESDDLLRNVIEMWKQVFFLLCESLCAKHGLDRNTVLTKGETPVLHEERTPGVGMEDGCSNISREEHTEDHSDKNDEIGTKMNRLEVEIKEACEVENYDRAAELQEELESIKTTL